jgi:valyl-tRNA synthetase
LYVLNNEIPSFIRQGGFKKAPEHVIEEERGKEKDYTAKREAVRQRIAELKG